MMRKPAAVGVGLAIAVTIAGLALIGARPLATVIARYTWATQVAGDIGVSRRFTDTERRAASLAVHRCGGAANARAVFLPIVVSESNWNIDVRHGAARIVGQTGSEGIASLTQSLCSRHNEDTLRVLARTLGEIGPGASSSVPQMINMLADQRRPVRIELVQALGKIGGNEAVAGIKRVENDADQEVRDSARRALDELRPRGDQE